MSITVLDTTGVLSGAEKADLEAVSSPFRVKALIENPASKGELNAHVRACVDTPNTVCIGVSPQLRYTRTEIGIDSGIKPAYFEQIGKAGSLDFKQAHWADGIKSIASRAAVLRTQEVAATPGVIVQEHQTTIDHPVSPWPFLLGFGLFGGLAGIVWYSVHKQQKRTQRMLENAERETAELAQRNLRDTAWATEIEKRVADKKPTPAPVVPKQVEAAPKRASTWDDVIERAKPKPQPQPFRGSVNLPPSQPLPRTRVSRARSYTPSPQVVVVPQPIFIPTPAPSYSPPPSYRSPTPAPTRRNDTPAPSYSSGSSGSSFSSGSDYSGGGGGSDFSGGGGGGDFSGGGGGDSF